MIAAGKRLGLDTLLAIMQILDQTLSRMRYSTQGRILAELALVRISHLEDLDELSEVIAQLQSGRRSARTERPVRQAAAAAKKKLEPAVASGGRQHGRCRQQSWMTAGRRASAGTDAAPIGPASS